MKKFMEKYLGKKGQGMVEYALIIAFVVGVAVTAFGGESGLGKAIEATFNKATATLNTLSGTTPAKSEGK